MKFISLLAVIIFVFVADLAAQPGVKASPVKVEGIVIETNSKFIDDKAFVTKMTAALNLLKTKSPDDLKYVQTYIGIIRARQASGANYNEEIMTIDIAKPTFDASLEWLASVLVHETTHIKKYKDTGKKYGDAHLMTDKKAALKVMIDEELACNAVQLVTLIKVGGAQYEVDYLRAQKGDHFDIDKDGDYDEDDYKARNWD